VKHGEGNTNSPELSLLKFLPLAYHQVISWPPPWISHLFLQWPFWGAHPFLPLGLDLAYHLFLIKRNTYVCATLTMNYTQNIILLDISLPRVKINCKQVQTYSQFEPLLVYSIEQ